MEWIYECVCGCADGKHKHLCEVWNRRKELELAEAWSETGIARFFREQESLTGIERMEREA